MHSSSRFVAALATAASISVSANAFADEPATEKATAPSTDAQPSNDPPKSGNIGRSSSIHSQRPSGATAFRQNFCPHPITPLFSIRISIT